MAYTVDRPTDWDKATYYGKKVIREAHRLITAYQAGDLEKMRHAEMQLESAILRFKTFAR